MYKSDVFYNFQAQKKLALPSWPMQTPLWITHESPTVQLLSAALYLNKF